LAEATDLMAGVAKRCWLPQMTRFQVKATHCPDSGWPRRTDTTKQIF